MMPPDGNLPWSRQSSHEIPHSNALEHRVTRLEVRQEDQEDINDRTSDRMRWLERGLQAIAVILLILVTKQAPTSASALADVLLAIIKR